MNGEFRKNYFRSFRDFRSCFSAIFRLAKRIRRTEPKDKISPAFAERIMLAVTGVNSCVYCSYRHAKTALEKGLSEEEIGQLLNGEFGNVPKEEQTALFYAQHWAETGGSPSAEAREKMIAGYGTARTEYIEFYIQIVSMGNLVSNTVEARRKKAGPAKGKLGFFLTSLLCVPIAGAIRKEGKKYAGDLKGRVGFLKLEKR